MILKSGRCIAIALTAMVSGFAPTALAQDYPERAIRLVVPQAAGGMADMTGRFLANGITEASMQPAVVENRPGGGTMIGSDVVARAEPDGYTLLLGTVSLTILPAIDNNLPFDPVADLTPISRLTEMPSVLLVHKSVPATTLKELVDYAKKNPGKLSYASQGIGTTGHMAGELFKQVAGIDMTHVPYRGSAPAAQDLIAGHVQLLFDALPLAIGNLKNGNIRAIAIASPERSKALPDVPTTAEAGLPSVLISAWFGLYAPAKTPDTIVNWLSEQAERTFNNPDVRKKLEGMGAMLPLTKPADFKRYMSEDVERWNKVAKAGKITIGNKPK